MSGAIPQLTFEPYPKTPRLNREVIVTEKIDGTNALIYIDERGERAYAGSKNRWITPASDNYGFARWVEENHDELLKLGPGFHHGEWWGRGIQKRYKNVEDKRFSLFNVSRWNDESKPSCCLVVPVLWRGTFEELMLSSGPDPNDQYTEILYKLEVEGSVAAPGNPAEGIVIFHTASGHVYKRLLENDALPKGAEADGTERA